MSSRTTLLVLLGVLALLTLVQPAAAFGAGNIPSFAYLEGKAFRHGDIEDVLEKLAKTAGGGFLSGLGGGKKFGGLDIKVRSSPVSHCLGPRYPCSGCFVEILILDDMTA